MLKLTFDFFCNMPLKVRKVIVVSLWERFKECTIGIAFNLMRSSVVITKRQGFEDRLELSITDFIRQSHLIVSYLPENMFGYTVHINLFSVFTYIIRFLN